MKHMSFAGLIFCCLLVTATAGAKTSSEREDEGIGGAGKPNFLAKFSSKRTIASSNVFQSPTTGNIGIGTTVPTVPLFVFSNNPVGPPGYNPITMWVESAADNAQGAVYAVSSSQVNGIALNGVVYSTQGNGVLGNYISSTGGGGG